MTFLETVIECSRNPEFVEQWARLRGLTFPKSSLERAIDETTGHSREMAQQFIADVWDLVWTRVQPEVQP